MAVNPEVVGAFVEYFKSELPVLEKSYKWKIPDVEGFEHSGDKGFLPNVKLKEYFNEQWKNSTPDKKVKLAKVVVSDWGGVRANNPSTITRYVDELSKENPETPLGGVASYSKIFSITDLERYAIYDARVAVSLNAIQINSGVSEGVAFNYIPGRNNTTGHSGKKIGFTFHEPFKIKNLILSGWSRIKRDHTYEVYLDLLNKCLEHLPGSKLYELEMVLFAKAEELAVEAMNNS